MSMSYSKHVYSAAIVTSLVGSFLLSAVSVANGQSPMDMMRMMTGGAGGDENETSDSMMMGGMFGAGGDNISMMPFKMGVLAMPMMCTTPAEMLGMVSGMFGGGTAADVGADGNETKQMMMDMMQQQMMMPSGDDFDFGGGMENMSEAELQHALEMVICFPMMDGKMMEGMMMGDSS